MPKFSSKFGLIAATVGSAVGLGNVWRFPSEVQANGGAVFLLIYICCILILGIPVMTAEFALGRGGESDATGVFARVTPRRKGWWLAGLLPVVASYLILSFYMVVSGWTLEYFIQSITGDLYQGARAGGGTATFESRMSEYIAGSWRPVIVTAVMIAANLLVLLRGVQKGIERMSNILMPLLFAILLVFCAVSLTLPGAAGGLSFFLAPDWSKFTPATVINALGQAFFSLSIGMGILVTYSSYFPSSTRLTRTSLTVALLDLMVAVLMGIIIFPAVMTFGLEDQVMPGSSLVFITLPEIFAGMELTRLWSALFFLLLSVAAFTSTISLAEVSVSFCKTRFGLSRTRACLLTCLPLFLLSTVCSLSVGPWSSVTICDMTIFDFLDNAATNYMLPVSGILLCIYMGWIAPRRFFRAQLTNNGRLRPLAFTLIRFIVRWIAPVLILVILLSQFF